MEKMVALEAMAKCLHQLVVTATCLHQAVVTATVLLVKVMVMQLLHQLVKVILPQGHVRTRIMVLWIHTVILVQHIKETLNGAVNTTPMTSILVRCVVPVEVEMAVLIQTRMVKMREMMEQPEREALVAMVTKH